MNQNQNQNPQRYLMISVHIYALYIHRKKISITGMMTFFAFQILGGAGPLGPSPLACVCIEMYYESMNKIQQIKI